MKYVNVSSAPWVKALIGKSIVSTEMGEHEGRLVLSDGTALVIQANMSDCCSYLNLTSLATTENIITAADIRDTDGGIEEYSTWIHVVTEAGEFKVAEADGDAGNGFYLHGWELDVEVVTP
jgi:hypothetical protein